MRKIIRLIARAWIWVISCSYVGIVVFENLFNRGMAVVPALDPVDELYLFIAADLAGGLVYWLMKDSRAESE